MKLSRAIFALSLLSPLLLAGCVQEDKDLVVFFAKEWGKQHGLYDEKGNMTKTAMARGLAGNLANWLKPDVKDENGNVDQAGNAAVDAGVVIKNVVDNDRLVEEAKKDLTANPPKTDDAKKKLDATVKSRPQDWYYRNERGAFLLMMGDTKGAEKDFEEGRKACSGNHLCLTGLFEHRAQLLEKLRADQTKTGPAPCATLRLLHHTYDLYLPLVTGNDFQRISGAIGLVKHDMTAGKCF